MIDLLEGSPLLTLFLVVATGAVLGAIPFGRVRFGAAGALFTGLALSAAAPHLGAGMDIVQSLGLALFVYTVGISAGAAFFSSLNRQLPLLAASAVSALLGALATLVLGQVLGLAKDLSLGLFTGALTAAPALDAANRITGSSAPSVGYAFGYPIGVIVGIVLVSTVVNRAWPGRRDTPAMAGTSLAATTVQVQHPANLRDVPQWSRQQVRFSYLRRDGRVRVIVPGEDLLAGDEVVAVGMPDAVDAVVEELGTRSDRHIAHDRSLVEFTRLTVSNPDLASRSIAELNLSVRFGAVVTRVRRGDLEMVARDDLVLEPGDRIAVVVERSRLDAVHTFLGDSDRKAGELDALSLGLGLVLGVALAGDDPAAGRRLLAGAGGGPAAGGHDARRAATHRPGGVGAARQREPHPAPAGAAALPRRPRAHGRPAGRDGAGLSHRVARRPAHGGGGRAQLCRDAARGPVGAGPLRRTGRGRGGRVPGPARGARGGECEAGRRAHRGRVRDALRLLDRGEDRAGPGALAPLTRALLRQLRPVRSSGPSASSAVGQPHCADRPAR